ncbi:MAG: nucleotidyltransferase family protein [Gemmatimonadota bacterium]
MNPLPPEARLLLLACREDAADRENGIRELLAGDLDWDRLLRWGHWHGVLPLLQRRLTALSDVGPPAAVRAALARQVRDSARRTLWLIHELLRLLKLLGEEGVTALPLKGPVLAATAYPDPGLREYDDLDLLVRPRDLPLVAGLLRSEGYASRDDLAGGRPGVLRRIWYVHAYRHPASGIDVEVHWRLAPSYFPTGSAVEGIWARAVRESVFGSELLVPSPADLLLAACIHGAKTEPLAWSRLKWSVDIAQLLRTGPLDWDLLMSRARSAGCRRAVSLGLEMGRAVVGFELPGSVASLLAADSTSVALAGEIRSEMFRPEPRVTPASRLRFELRVRERMADRAVVVLRRLLLPDITDLGRVRLPRPLGFLYYPLHWMRVVWSGLLGPWRG